jgi:hypothetical protein
MIYWVTETLYYETREQPLQFSPTNRVEVPVAMAVFPKELPISPRSFAERGYNILCWTLMLRGGHFAAMEQPGLLAQDIREFFRPLSLLSKFRFSHCVCRAAR